MYDLDAKIEEARTAYTQCNFADMYTAYYLFGYYHGIHGHKRSTWSNLRQTYVDCYETGYVDGHGDRLILSP